MTDFRGCIDAARLAGAIDEDAAASAREAYDDAHAAASEMFGPVDADRMGADAALARLEAEKVEARRRRAQMIRTRRAVVEGVAGLKRRRGYEGVREIGGGGRDGGRPPSDGWHQGGRPREGGPKAQAARALELIVENKPGQAGGPFPSIAGRYRKIRGSFDAMMADLIERFETRTGFDQPGRAVLDNVRREGFGVDTGDPAAKALWEAWRETAEAARQRFNAAGGAIGLRSDWGFPQWHDPVRVRSAGKQAWVEAILPRLDRTRMIDRATGKPFSEARLRAAAGQAWDRIASQGAAAREAGEGVGRGMLAKQRGEERFFIFKSAEDHAAYQAEFGEPDLFATMMGHLDEMARDIARMEILGPNPDHQWEWLRKWALREAQLEEAAGAQGAIDKAKGYVATADDMLAHFTGSASTPINSRLSAVGVSARAVMTGLTLGSAVVQEGASGVYFGRMARAFTGLDRNGDMGRLLELLNPADGSMRRIARRSGFINEQAMDGFIRATQDNLRLMTVGDRATGGANAFARRLPAFILRSQFLTPLVAARKRSFWFEFMGALHDRRGLSLADMARGDAEDRALAAWLGARGFTEADWAIIRAAPTWEPRSGAAFLRPEDVAHPELRDRLGEAIELETRFATPETSLWTRAKLIGQERPGSWRGERDRSWAMYRSFSMTATHLYGEEMALRGLAEAGGDPLRTAYVTGAGLASVMAWLTITGAVGLQLREIVKGNDPRPMDDWRFWGAALLQGGGLGIFGDFLYAAEARNGAGASQVAAFGPVGQALGDAWNLTGGNVAQIAEGLDQGETLGEAVEGAAIGRDLANAVRRYNPAATLWWSRLVWNRTVADNLQRMLDPEAEASFRARVRRLERERGQGQWWPEGAQAPERPPDLTAAWGGMEEAR